MEPRFPEAMKNCLNIIDGHKEKIDGIKISLLDADLEVSMRRSLPSGVRMYTGDDFNYDRLILGDDQGHSDALLGIFDAIAPAASLALAALDTGDVARYQQLPCTHSPALTTHLCVANSTLQNWSRLPGISEWISVALPHGSRCGKRTIHRTSVRTVRACRPSRSVARS